VLRDLRGHDQCDYPDDSNAYSETLTVADMAAPLDQVGADSAVNIDQPRAFIDAVPIAR
jgi:hypothetical protein